MENNTKDLILECINNDYPLVLFVGQNYLDNDVVLKNLQKKIDREDIHWSDLHLIDLNNDDQNFLREQFTTIRLPESNQTTFQLNWSAVFTSSIDPRIVTALRSRNREPETIIKGKDYIPKNIRSTIKPPIFYLFSNAEMIHTNEAPPFKNLQYRERKRIDSPNMLQHITDSVASGVLIVEGFGKNDWLDDIDDLLIYAKNFQIIFCGVEKNSIVESTEYQDFLKQGRILEETRSISELISELFAENKVDFSDLQEIDDIISIGNNNYLEFNPQDKIQIESSAYIIHDSWLNVKENFSDKDNIELFRKFHGGTLSLRNNFLSVLSGYIIRREFEENLFTKVYKNEITILKGEPASGKSIALVALAIKLRKEYHLPVLYANMIMPSAYDVDLFCHKAEEAGAKKSVIICDLNTDESEYFNLLKNLKSKGRNVTIVGTTYKSSLPSNNISLIEASSRISEKEFNKLNELLEKYYPRLSNRGIKLSYNKTSPQYFLPLLYRRLIDARPVLTNAIIRQARMIKDHIANNILAIERKLDQTVFRKLLEQAGFNIEKSEVDDTEDTIDREFQDIAYKLLDYVMVLTKNYKGIPIHLLIKALSNDQKLVEKQINIYENYTKELYHLIHELNYFVVTHNDDLSYINIKARSTIEAETYCKIQNINIDDEIDIMCNIIKSIDNSTYDNKFDKNYILELIKLLEDKGLPIRGYKQLVEAMDYIRDHKGYMDDYSLALREASILRHIIKISDGNNSNLDDSERYELLEKARKIIQSSLDRLNQNTNINKNTLSNLNTELAAIYGYKTIGETKVNNRNNEKIETDYNAAIRLINSSYNDVNYYPVDTQLWIMRDLLQKYENSDFHALIKADYYSLIDQVDQDILSPQDKERFLQKKVQISKIFGDSSVHQNTIEKLIQLSPDKGHYVKARSMCSEIFNGSSYSQAYDEKVLKATENAYKYLLENIDQLRENSLKLLFELYWIVNTKEKYSTRKAQQLYDDNSFISEGLGYLEKLFSVTEVKSNKFMFLKAVFSWMSGKAIEAENIWKELEISSDYNDPRRTKFQLFLAEKNKSESKKYDVFIDRKIDSKRWEGSLLNQEYSRKVTVTQKSFYQENLQEAQTLRGVTIAFNYIGVLALKDWK